MSGFYDYILPKNGLKLKLGTASCTGGMVTVPVPRFTIVQTVLRETDYFWGKRALWNEKYIGHGSRKDHLKREERRNTEERQTLVTCWRLRVGTNVCLRRKNMSKHFWWRLALVKTNPNPDPNHWQLCKLCSSENNVHDEGYVAQSDIHDEEAHPPNWGSPKHQNRTQYISQEGRNNRNPCLLFCIGLSNSTFAVLSSPSSSCLPFIAFSFVLRVLARNDWKWYCVGEKGRHESAKRQREQRQRQRQKPRPRQR